MKKINVLLNKYFKYNHHFYVFKQIKTYINDDVVLRRLKKTLLSFERKNKILCHKNPIIIKHNNKYYYFDYNFDNYCFGIDGKQLYVINVKLKNDKVERLVELKTLLNKNYSDYKFLDVATFSDGIVSCNMLHGCCNNGQVFWKYKELI